MKEGKIMLETILYLNISKPKTLSFIDEETKKYINLKVKLKNNISEFAFKKFLFEMADLKLNLLSKGITDTDSIKELKLCFKEILKTDSVISLKSLYELMTNLSIQEFSILNERIEQFFDMFEIINRSEYSIDVYNEMVRYLHTNQLFLNQDSDFEKEVKVIKYNSYFFNSKYLSKCKMLKQETNHKERLLIKEKSIG